MLNQPFPVHDTEFILSPTETEERKARSKTLEKIDQEIERIMSLNHVQSQQYKEFMEKITFIEDVYKKQNNALKQSLQIMTQKYQSLQKMYLSLKEELEDNFNHSQVIVQENQMLNKQVAKLKTMIHNQESLIDQYRKNIQEQITLQKQFLKSEFDQQKSKLTREFNKILIQLEKQQENKIKKMNQQTKLKQYKVEYKDVKKYLLNKENSQKQLIKSESKLIKPSHSQYSTNDQENRHNQPIYFL